MLLRVVADVLGLADVDAVLLEAGPRPPVCPSVSTALREGEQQATAVSSHLTARSSIVSTVLVAGPALPTAGAGAWAAAAADCGRMRWICMASCMTSSSSLCAASAIIRVLSGGAASRQLAVAEERGRGTQTLTRAGLWRRSPPAVGSTQPPPRAPTARSPLARPAARAQLKPHLAKQNIVFFFSSLQSSAAGLFWSRIGHRQAGGIISKSPLAETSRIKHSVRIWSLNGPETSLNCMKRFGNVLEMTAHYSSR